MIGIESDSKEYYHVDFFLASVWINFCFCVVRGL